KGPAHAGLFIQGSWSTSTSDIAFTTPVFLPDPPPAPAAGYPGSDARPRHSASHRPTPWREFPASAGHARRTVAHAVRRLPCFAQAQAGHLHQVSTPSGTSRGGSP